MIELNKVIQGDCLEVMKELDENSIDAIVCDPPYELGFMGKSWDNSGIAYSVELWKEALRALKPGGHLLAFSGTRTYHRMTCAIEDAGFEIRDMLEWIYASGFPKSLNVGKAVDKLQGNEREIVGTEKIDIGMQSGAMHSGRSVNIVERDITKGNSEWEGFGTALKPAHEPIVLARKPLSEKTIVNNVLKHGTGALDIDGCRIPTQQNTSRPHYDKEGFNCYGKYNDYVSENHELGRFPANILCSDDALNDGEMTKGKVGANGYWGMATNKGWNKNNIEYYSEEHNSQSSDSGSKSRYFDIDVWAEKHGLLQFPKASRSERNKGCEGLEEKAYTNINKIGGETSNFKTGSGNDRNIYHFNNHPTIKPVHLMAWLIRLISKENDVVLDPFGGSGTTAVACINTNRNFILIEKEAQYCEICQHRINKAFEDNKHIELDMFAGVEA